MFTTSTIYLSFVKLIRRYIYALTKIKAYKEDKKEEGLFDDSMPKSESSVETCLKNQIFK